MMRPWYQRAEWIVAIITVTMTFGGVIWSQSQSWAQTSQNTQDIRDLRLTVSIVPDRLARIEQKVDDLKELEARRVGERD